MYRPINNNKILTDHLLRNPYHKHIIYSKSYCLIRGENQDIRYLECRLTVGSYKTYKNGNNLQKNEL